MAKSPHHLNNWAYLDKLKASFEDGTYEGMRCYSDLKRNWESIRDHGKNILAKQRDEATDPLEAFFSNVYEGVIPPPEQLLFIADCFMYYIQQNGKVELEDVFFGPKKSGVGNYAARLASKEKYYFFELAKYLYEKNNETSISDSKFADKYFDENVLCDETQKEANKTLSVNFDTDLDSFKRGLRRYRSEKADK